MGASEPKRIASGWIEGIWRAPDSRGLAAALIVIVVGGVTVGQTLDTGNRATPITALLIVATLLYGIISERLSEFTGPGGWSAKFVEHAGKSIKQADAVIRYKSVDVNFLQKVSPEETMRRLVESREDTRPLVLTLTLGQSFESAAFASVLTAFATVPNYRGIAVLGETKRLVAYSSARQISWLSSANCEASRSTLLKDIHEKNEDDIIKHMSMSTVSAYNGASYTEVLRKMIEENLSCIAIIDNHNRLCGIVDRDRFSAALVLSLIEAAEGKEVSGGQVGNMPVM